MSKTVIVPTNAKMTYTVSKEGYETVKDHVVVVGDVILNITLEEKVDREFTLTINPTPSDAVVTLTADG